MSTGEKLDVLESRITEVSELLGGLQTENASLRRENEQLRSELMTLRQHCQQLQIAQTDRSNAFRERLQTVLARLDELEQLQA